MQNKATVVYHSADTDGQMCREIARKFLKNEVVAFQGWDYKDPKLDFPSEGMVYVLDLNPECFKEFPGIDLAKERVVWIDHHKTAIEKWGTYLRGIRIEGVAACRLAWIWFSAWQRYTDQAGKGEQWFADHYPFPTKDLFLNREVNEPLAVRLAGEYDVWDHRGDGDLEFQLGLRAQEEIPWQALLEDGESTRLTAEQLVARLITSGRFVQTYVKKQSALKAQEAFRLKWRGLTFLALNDASKGSLTFESIDKPENGHDALMRFYWTGKAWEFSLYHAAHRKDLDLSDIAKAYGGGGHPGACGFRTIQIPFPLYPQP